MATARQRQFSGKTPPTRSFGRPALLVGGIIALAALGFVGLSVLSPSKGQQGSTGNAATGISLVAYQGEALLGGSRVDLGAVLGHGKPVVVNFFAGQCPPCRAEMPGFQHVYQRHQGQFLLVGADIGPFVGLGSHEDAKQLLAELSISYPAGYVEDNPVQTVRIAGMPTTILYDGAGRQVARHTGLVTEDQLEQEIVGLIGTGS